LGVVFGLTSDVHADLVRALDRQGLDPQAKEKIERELSTTFRDLKKQREAEEKQRKIEEEMETRRLAEEAAEEVIFSLFVQRQIQDMLFATHLLITHAQVTFVRHTRSADRAQTNIGKRRACARQPKTRTRVLNKKNSLASL
jgi:hypothetical protein